MVRVPWKAQAMGKRTSAIVEHVDLCLLLTIPATSHASVNLFLSGFMP